MSILSNTYQENLQQFLNDGQFQLLVSSDETLQEIFSREMTTDELLRTLHDYFGIGYMQNGLRTRRGREMQLKSWNTFNYIYNLATFPHGMENNPFIPERIHPDVTISGIHYIEALPLAFSKSIFRTFDIGGHRLNYIDDIVRRYPYIDESVMPEIDTFWNDAARDEYWEKNTGDDVGWAEYGKTIVFFPKYPDNSRITTRQEFDLQWNRVLFDQKLLHYYIYKTFSVDTRLEVCPVTPHQNTKLEGQRWRYFTYQNEFQHLRNPEVLRGDGEIETQIPEIGAIAPNMYYKMEYLTVNATSSWQVVYNNLHGLTYPPSQYYTPIDYQADQPRSPPPAPVPEGDEDGDGVVRRLFDDNDDVEEVDPGGKVGEQKVQDVQAAGAGENPPLRETFFQDPRDDSWIEYHSANHGVEPSQIEDPIVDYLNIPEGTRLKYISYWKETDTVLCYCDGPTSREIRESRGIQEEYPRNILPMCFRVGTENPFYVYLPRSAVSCKVIDIQADRQVLVSLADKSWGTAGFYTKYNLVSTVNSGDKTNGKCIASGWRILDIKRAIQYSGVELRGENFPTLARSVASQAEVVANAIGAGNRVYVNINSMKRRLRVNLHRIRSGVNFFKLYYHRRTFIPNYYYIPSPRIRLPSRIWEMRRGRGEVRSYIPQNVLDDNDIVILTHSREFLSEEHREEIEVADGGGSSTTIDQYLAMAADVEWVPRRKIIEAIDKVRRQELTITQKPKEEWENLCSRMNQSQIEIPRLKEILTERSAKYPRDIQAKLLEGIDQLSRRQLCEVLAQRNLADEQRLARKVGKMLAKRRAQELEKFPNPKGLCENYRESMTVSVTDQDRTIESLIPLYKKLVLVQAYCKKYGEMTINELQLKNNEYIKLKDKLDSGDSGDVPLATQQEISDWMVEFLAVRDAEGRLVNPSHGDTTTITELINEEYLHPQNIDGDLRIRDSQLNECLEFQEEYLYDRSTLKQLVDRDIEAVWRDYIDYLDVENPIRVKHEWRVVNEEVEFTFRDLKQMVDNYLNRPDPTFEEAQARDFFILVRVDGKAKCIHKSALDIARNSSLCEYVAPSQFPDALEDPGFDNGQYSAYYDKLPEGQTFGSDPVTVDTGLPQYQMQNRLLTCGIKCHQRSSRRDGVLQLRDGERECLGFKLSRYGECVHYRDTNSVVAVPEEEELASTGTYRDTQGPPTDTTPYFSIDLDVKQNTLYYPLEIGGASAEIGEAYFVRTTGFLSQADFDKINRYMGRGDNVVHVFYLGEGEMIRVGNCEGIFGMSSTHGQKYQSNGYPILHHRTLGPDLIAELAKAEKKESVDPVLEQKRDGLNQKRTAHYLEKTAAGNSHDIPKMKDIQRSIDLVDQQLVWVNYLLNPEKRAEDRAGVISRIEDEYNKKKELVANTPPDRTYPEVTTTPRDMEETLMQMWSPFLVDDLGLEADIGSLVEPGRPYEVHEEQEGVGAEETKE